ncbi:hypothetical protein ACWDXH_29725 [Micromonospora chokoriensis]
MSNDALSPLCAAGLASLIALIEVVTWRRKPATVKAIHWISLKLMLEGGTAAFAHAALVAALGGLSWFNGPWPPLVAGLAGPALLRSQLALLGSGQEASYYGPANAYCRLQRRINQAIDDICAVSQSVWINRKVMPFIFQIPLERLEERVRTYINALDRLSDSERQERLDFVRSVLNDTKAKDSDRYHAIVQRLLDDGGQRFVKSLLRSGAVVPKQPSAPEFPDDDPSNLGTDRPAQSSQRHSGSAASP